MDLTFKIVAHKSREWKAAVNLREEVLRKPLGSFFTIAELEEEKKHVHVVAYLDGKLVGTAVLVPEKNTFKMQRVAVVDALRNANIGSNMMAYCEAIASEQDISIIYCHARNSAVNFYLKNGYATEGAYFDEDGIPHVKMSKTL